MMEILLSSGRRGITGEFTGKMNEMKQAIKEGKQCLSQLSYSEVMVLGWVKVWNAANARKVHGTSGRVL